MAARAGAAAERGARVAALGARLWGRRAETGTERRGRGRRASRTPAGTFLLPVAGGGAGRGGGVPGALTPSRRRPRGSHPLLRGGTRDSGARAATQGRPARAWVAEPRLRPRVRGSARGASPSRQRIWTRGNPDTTHLQPSQGGDALPSGRIRTPGWGRQRRSGLRRFSVTSTTAVPPLPSHSPPPPTYGRPVCQPNPLSVRPLIFHSKLFCPQAFINSFACVPDPALPRVWAALGLDLEAHSAPCGGLGWGLPIQATSRIL